MKFTLFIPTKNEFEGSRLIMPRISRTWVDEIIVIDANSDDGTYEYFLENGYKIFRQKSDGICGAYWDCFEKASGDVIIAFSPDNNSIPEKIPELIDKMKEGYDMVVVSRYLNGAKSEDDDVITGFGNWMFTRLVNLLFGSNYTDTLVMFRAFRSDLVKRLELNEKTMPVLEMQMSIRCAKMKLRVAEIPGNEPKRIGGTRKMRPFYNGSTILWLILKECFRWWPQGRLELRKQNETDH